MSPRLLILLVAFALPACGGDSEKLAPASAPRAASNDHVTVDHILIGVQTAEKPSMRRNEADARAFAYELIAQLRAGGDWDEAKRLNSEDPPPGGPYSLANRGVRLQSQDEFGREGMVPGFSDVAFSLAVGGMGMADYNARTSPFGYHIIKRIK